MEAGGHYYTVYYTSLAVGFSNKTAFLHAVLAQMPDQVSWMDAAHMHIRQCTGFNVPDFNNVSREVTAAERYRMEYGLHSLPNKDLNARTRTSAYQREQTAGALLAESPVSLKFGLLLHRLGDTFAHSRISNPSVMYTVNTGDTCFRPGNLWNYKNEFGHGHDGHDPDYPFLRENIFYSYLEKLHFILAAKIKEPGSAPYRREGAAVRPFHQVKADFGIMFINVARRARTREKEMQELINRSARYGGRGVQTTVVPTSNEIKADWFIDEIRKAADRNLKQEINKEYKPEKDEGVSLPQFLANPRLKGSGVQDMRITGDQLQHTIDSMMPPPAATGAPVKK